MTLDELSLGMSGERLAMPLWRGSHVPRRREANKLRPKHSQNRPKNNTFLCLEGASAIKFWPRAWRFVKKRHPARERKEDMAQELIIRKYVHKRGLVIKQGSLLRTSPLRFLLPCIPPISESVWSFPTRLLLKRDQSPA